MLEAADGEAALEITRARRPDLILLDIQMPKMDGITALSEIREFDPHVSVVIISAANDKEMVEEALELGAVNFLQKPLIPDEIEFVLDRVYRAIEEDADVVEMLASVERRVTELSIPNDQAMLSKIVAYLGRELQNNYPTYEIPVTEIKLALYEALANALEHGNLGISFDEKTKAMAEPGGVGALIQQRMQDEELAKREIHVSVEYGHGSVEFRVRDEGRGFDHQKARVQPLADTTALHGRGITLMQHYMDDVSWNESGTEVRMRLKMEQRPVSQPTP